MVLMSQQLPGWEIGKENIILQGEPDLGISSNVFIFYLILFCWNISLKKASLVLMPWEEIEFPTVNGHQKRWLWKKKVDIQKNM